jgi:hypothetical protein
VEPHAEQCTPRRSATDDLHDQAAARRRLTRRNSVGRASRRDEATSAAGTPHGAPRLQRNFWDVLNVSAAGSRIFRRKRRVRNLRARLQLRVDARKPPERSRLRR